MSRTQKPLRLAIVTGEPSGDRQGAALIAAVRRLIAPRELEAWGVGTDLMRAEGVTILHDCGPWASIGIAATVANIPHLLGVRASLKRALLKDPPDALVVIDAGAFNVPLARWTKQNHICPVFYYFPPGSWRQTPRASSKRAGDGGMADVADRIVTPFPWSERFLTASGASAHFVGHPLLDLVAPTLTASEFHSRYGLDPLRPLVALLPGSRKMEITHILPAMIGAAGEIARRIPGVQFALALGSGTPRALVEEIIRKEQKLGGRAARLQLFIHQAGDKLAQIAHSTFTPPIQQLATNEGLTMPPPSSDEGASVRERPLPSHAPLVICEGLTYDVMARSDLVITKSGTSTLEAAILQKPMIIVYRGSKLMEFEYALRKRALNISHMGLPNILAGERLFPELIQDEATPEAISELALEMLLQPERLLNIKDKLADLIRVNLGEPGGVKRSAELLVQLITDQDLTEYDDAI